jgi:hypothetical protein
MPIYYCGMGANNRHFKLCAEKRVNGKIADALTWGWLVNIFSDPDKMKEGLMDFANHQNTQLADKKRRLEFLANESAQTKRKIGRLTNEIKNQEDDEVLAALRVTLKDVGKYRANLENERMELSAEIERADMGNDKQAQILEWAAEIGQGINDDDVSFEAKRTLVDMLDVKAQIEYRDGQRGIYATCVLAYADKWLPFAVAYSSTGHCPCRG